MTDVRPGGNRRIDRVLDPMNLHDLAAQSLPELRQKRREAAQEETELSYLRRLLHGRIDVVRTEQARRAGSGEPVVDELPDALAETGRGARALDRVRHLVTEPARRRRRVERLVSDVDLSDVAARTDDELARVLRTYEDEERQVSAVLTAVQQVLDACSAELARRYADGDAAVAELLDADIDEEQRGRA